MVAVPWRLKALIPGYPEISSAVQDDETEELARLAGGREVLEIGSAWGYSAIACVLGGAVHVTAVDPHEEDPDTWDGMTVNLKAYGVADRVTRIRQRSQEALPALAAQGRRFGLVFLDGDHEEESVRHDLAGSLPLLDDGGWVVLHDYDNAPGVRPAVDQVFPAGPVRLVHSLFTAQAPGEEA